MKEKVDETDDIYEKVKCLLVKKRENFEQSIKDRCECKFFQVLIVNLEMREIAGTNAQIEFNKNVGNERARDKVRPMSVTWRQKAISR